MKHYKRFLALSAAAAMAVSLAACGSKTEQPSTGSNSSDAEATGFIPSKNVTWVCTSSAGGGSDIFSRQIADIMKNEDLVNGQTIVISNETDGSGEVGRNKVATMKAGDADYTLLTFNSGDLMPMVTNTQNRSSNFRILAIMAVDKQLLFSCGSTAGKTDYAKAGGDLTDFGAAVEAAKSFLPELIRLFVILLCVVLLVPMLVFTALPNILFGYSSSTDQEIIDFTASAQELDGIYQNLDNYQQPAVLRLVNSILPRFWSDGEPLYDDYGVDQDLGYMNKYWLMAIGSVRYKQDLYTMDESAIEDMMYDRLTYSTSLIDRILNIFVRDLTPEEYMDKLNFTQEERDWAALLYSMLAEDQNLSYGDSDGDGYYNTDYGDITFSDAETPVVYYNQTDSRWGNKMYGKSGTIGEAGCGPTALAIAVASLTSNQVTPYDVAQWSVENGYRCEGNGSYHSLIPNGGAHYGLTVTGVGNDSKRLVDALKNGKLVIAIMSKGHFTSSGHFIVLRGVTEGGKILVADPASVKRSNQEWELGIILNEASRRAGSGGPFWVMSA